MISQTSICNMALAHFGGGSITSIDEGTTEAKLLSTYYDNSLQTVLRAFPWAFARYIDTLDLLSVTVPNFDYVYLYPVNCLKIYKVCAEGDLEEVNYKNEYKLITDGALRYIASNIANAYIDYTYDVTDVNLFDAQFANAFSFLLAANICNTLTGNSNLAKEMLQKYQLAISEAQVASATEMNMPFELPGSYVKGRR